jgi:hypothetical protein
VVSVAATVLVVVAQASLTVGGIEQARLAASKRDQGDGVETGPAHRTLSATPQNRRFPPAKRTAPHGGGSRVPVAAPVQDGGTPAPPSRTRASPPGATPAPAAPSPTPTSPPRVGPAVILASLRPEQAAVAPVGDSGAHSGREPGEHGAAHAQRARLDEAYAAQDLGRRALARLNFAAAANGPDADVSARAREELGSSWLEEAYDRKALGDLDGASAAFRAARDAGVDPQQVEAELGYLAATRGRPGEARGHFAAAAQGADASIAGEAREELRFLPRHRWTEVYAEVFGWHRAAGVDPGGDVVPSTRLRFLYRPDLDRDLNLFVGLHLSRDFGWGSGFDAVPRTYAEGLIVAAGVLFRTWERRLSLFAQAGPAVHASDAPEEEQGPRLDVRVGAELALESSQCWPAPAEGVELRWRPCADGWAEVLFASRFERDVGLDVRGRGGGSFLVTGPLAWGVVAELRGALDAKGALYGELAEAGAGLRVRLLAPLRVDVIASVNRGRWLGLVRPPPDPTTYTDLRFLVATYLEL